MPTLSRAQALSVTDFASTLAYSASMTPDCNNGDSATITVTDGNAFVINAPLNPVTGMLLSFLVRNTFGVLGAVTWNAIFKMSAWTQPANGFSRSITFRYDGTNWIQINPAGVDVPN